MESKRDQILFTAWHLFESQGYHATGINQIISESGVPKGSFYHYFPEGKEGLATEAIAAITDGLQGRLRATRDCAPGTIEAVADLFQHVAHHLAKSDFQQGGPLTTVALETATTNERLNQACQAAYRTLRQELIDQLTADSFTEPDARELSITILAALEGGIMLSRTLHSTEPMEQISIQITDLLRLRQGAPTPEHGA